MADMDMSKVRKFFGSDRHHRTLEEILLPTEEEVEFATAKHMKRYDELVAEFEKKTALTGLDLSVLTICAGLQVLRWAILSNDKLKFDTAAQGDELVKRYLPKSVYDVVAGSVPYDAIQRSGQFALKYPGESVGISGANHRFKTLGHDPLAGWIVGTANIATNTMTLNNLERLYPSYYVNAANQIDEKTSMAEIVSNLMDEFSNKPEIVGISFLKQAVHFGSDVFTRQGLPLPVINLVSPEASRILMGPNARIDLWSVTRAAALAMVINKLVEMFHRLWFDPKRDNERLYEVRTRKVIVYSNTLSSLLNVGYVAVSKNLTKLDIGGIAVALWRLFTDTSKMREIRAEFIEKTLDNEFQKEEDEVNERLAKFGYHI